METTELELAPTRLPNTVDSIDTSGPPYPAIVAHPASLRLMPIEYLVSDPDNERGDISDEDLTDLVLSIRERGILNPLCVFRLSEERYMISSGHRRKRAAEIADLTRVPVYVVPPPERQLDRHLDRLTHNLQRVDLNDMARARGYRNILDTCEGVTQEQLAEKLGLSQPAISNALRLLRLPDPIQKMIEEGRLSQGHGVALLAITEPWVDYNGKQTHTVEAAQLELADRHARNGYSVRLAESDVKAQVESNRGRKKWHEEELKRREAEKAKASKAARKEPTEVELAAKRQTELREARYAVANDALSTALSWDEAHGPTLDHLRLAARTAADALYSSDGRPYEAGLPDRAQLDGAIEKAEGELPLLNILARLAVVRVRPDWNGMAVEFTKYGSNRQGKWADERFGINKAITDALQKAGLLEEDEETVEEDEPTV